MSKIDREGFVSTSADLPEHFAAIGRLIMATGSVEISVRFAFAQMLGSHAVAAAWVGGARFSDLSTALLSLTEVMNPGVVQAHAAAAHSPGLAEALAQRLKESLPRAAPVARRPRKR